jgi:hypothetical protein
MEKLSENMMGHGDILYDKEEVLDLQVVNHYS